MRLKHNYFPRDLNTRWHLNKCQLRLLYLALRPFCLVNTSYQNRLRITSEVKWPLLYNQPLYRTATWNLKLKTDENIVILPPERYGWLLLWIRQTTTTKKTPLLTTNWPKRYLNETRQRHCNANLTTNCFNTLKKTDKIYFRRYNRLRCSVPQPPNIRIGYLHLHKPNIPMRPIDCFRGSPTYQLSMQDT